MSPMTLLRLWKERWGLSDGPSLGALPALAAERLPLANGLAQASLWSMRGVVPGALVIAVPLLAAATFTPTDLPGQSAFALVLLAMGVATRRQAGSLAFLLLMGLCALAGARYLAWRWNATLPGPPLAVFGLALWLAECMVWAALLLWMSGRLAPPTRRSPAMTDATMDASWHAPYIDVVVVAGTAGNAAVRRIAHAASHQAWPPERLRVFLQDAEGIHAWTGDGLRIAPGDARDPTWLPAGNGAFVLKIEAAGPEGQLDDPALLRHWIAWMHLDPQLAMLYGPASPLAPACCDLAREQVQPVAGACLTLLRRTAVAGLPADTTDSLLANRLLQQGHRIAMMGLSPERADDAAGPDGSLDASLDWLRIDAADDTGALRRRLRRQAMLNAVRKPTRLALRTIALAGWALPVFGVLLVDAPLSWHLAYALPYAALASLAWTRAHAPEHGRLSVELRDWLSMLALPLITALHAFAEFRRARPGMRFGHLGVRDTSLFWLYIVALVVGALRVPDASPAMRPWLIAACLGIAYAVLLRVSAWAVEEERRTLHSEQLRMRLQTAELQYEGETTDPVEVEIVNFPEHPLRFAATPARAANDTQARLRLHDAPGFVLHGRLHAGGDAGPRFCPEDRELGQLPAIAADLQMRYLQRHYWLPGSRLLTALRQSMPLRARRRPEDDDSHASAVRSPFPHRSNP